MAEAAATAQDGGTVNDHKATVAAVPNTASKTSKADLIVRCSCGETVCELSDSVRTRPEHDADMSLPLDLINDAMTAHLVWADSLGQA